MNEQQLHAWLDEILSIGRECEWLEFKRNNSQPEEIAAYVSALANSAAIAKREFAYLIWGIDDSPLSVVGTSFDPWKATKGSEPLINWLSRSIFPQLDLKFFRITKEEKPLVLLRIPRASHQAIRFGSEEFIRVDAQKRKLKDYPELAKKLWKSFDLTPFESVVALDDLPADRVLALLDFSHCFDKLGIPLPRDQAGILARLCDERLVVARPGGRFDITNLGAILFAKNLGEFRGLRRKLIRIVKYQGVDRIDLERQWEDEPAKRGYALSFEPAVAFVRSVVGHNEPIGQALREVVSMYPPIAIRELVANAIIHQDFSVTGAGPTIEIFSDRIEFTNPGQPLIATSRFIDGPPRSRNEALAALARRLQMCEELGTGIDKVISAVEMYQLPPPEFLTPLEFTRVLLFSHKPLQRMTQEERIRACLQHACLQVAMGRQMSNSTLRKRFGIEEKNSARASRIIRDAVDAGAIKPVDAQAGRKFMKYVPSWC